jgi:hypothetical protein
MIIALFTDSSNKEELEIQDIVEPTKTTKLYPLGKRDSLKLKSLEFGGKSQVIIDNQQDMLYTELTYETNKLILGRTSLDQIPIGRILDTLFATVSFYVQTGLITTSFDKIGLKVSFINDTSLIAEGEIGEISAESMNDWISDTQFIRRSLNG